MTWLRKQKLLFDIQQAAQQVQEFVADTTSLAAYRADARTRSAVLWHLVIVGEAMGRLRRDFPDLALPDAPAIIGLRNRLVHAYDGIDDETVWVIVQRHLPRLLAAVDALLGDDGAASASLPIPAKG